MTQIQFIQNRVMNSFVFEQLRNEWSVYVKNLPNDSVTNSAFSFEKSNSSHCKDLVYSYDTINGIYEYKEVTETIALRLSDPPEGRNGWTLRLLAEKVVELEIAPAVSRCTIQRTLKKTK